MTRDSLLVSTRSIQRSLDDDNGAMVNVAPIAPIWHPSVIAVYSFFALRRVYGQGRLVTLLKMVVLLVGYFVALIVTMALTLALTAVTV